MDNIIKLFLDELRDSGEINMFAAAHYLMEEFYLSKQEAKEILGEYLTS